MDAFPIFMCVADRTLIVFGGGEEAAAKLRLLAKTSARVVAVSDEFDVELPERVERVLAAPLAFPLPKSVAFAYAATGDERLDAQIAARLRQAGVPVCAADQPAVSDFFTPAIVDRDPVVVAIGTEGTAPVLAREIKARVERLLPARLGRVARKAGALRAYVAQRLAPGHERRRFWHALFASALDGAFERTGFGRTARALLADNDTPTAGRVSFVGAGAAGADLLTERARQRLDRADVVLTDALVAPEILELARREATLINVGKRAGRHAMRQDEINALIVAHAKAGRMVVRLKGGDPSIFGRLAEEIDAAQAADVPFEIVPGVTAASVAAAAVAAPLTERGRAQELRVVTGHGAEEEVEAVDWRSAASGTAPLAIYMGRRTAPRLAAKLMAHGRAPGTEVALVESAGREDERIVHTTLAGLAEGLRALPGVGPLMVLVGMQSRLAPSLDVMKEAA